MTPPIAIESDSQPVPSAQARSALTGVIIRNCAGRAVAAGPGRLEFAAGSIAWPAPASDQLGPPIDVSAGGLFVLADGRDPDAWIQIEVFAQFLPSHPTGVDVQIDDVFNSAFAGLDVTADEALAGVTGVSSVRICNTVGTRIFRLTAGLDPACAYLEISPDGETWSVPTSEDLGLLLGDLAVDAGVDLYVRRTIPAATGSDPSVLSQLHLSFDAL